MSDLHQLKWKCRRGTLELDLLVGRFLEKLYPSAPLRQQHAFQRLLEYPDDKLYDLLTGKDRAQDKDIDDVVQRICNPPSPTA